MKVIAVIAILCMTATSCIKEKLPQGADLKVGDRIPGFSVTLDNGEVVGTEQLLGSVSFIMFFHTGCPDCRHTLPLAQELYYRYGSVKFLFISREEGAEAVAAYWEANNLDIPFAAQADRTIYNLFATSSIPRIYISGPDGTILSVFTDTPLPEAGTLAQALDEALSLTLGETPP